jgi:glycosyltransferase involved in cell wall biosynthesis
VTAARSSGGAGATDERSGEPRGRIVFFVKVADRRLLDTLEFYRNDIRALERLGYTVEVENRLSTAMRAGGDVLFCWWWVKALPAVAAWKLRRRPTVVTGAVDFKLSVLPLAKRLVKGVLTWACIQLSDENLAISEEELSLLPRSLQRRVEVVYPAVDTEFYRPGSGRRQSVGLTIGQLYPFSIRRKGIDVAIAATEHVRRAIPDYRLDVVGPLSREGERWLADARRRYDFSGVHVLGEVSRDEKLAHLRAASVYLQPSEYDGFGLSMVEAMACGTPVVCSCEGALPEVVGEGGRVVRERTPEAVAAAIVDVLSSPAAGQDLGAKAHARAQEFSVLTRSKGLEAVLTSVWSRDP